MQSPFIQELHTRYRAVLLIVAIGVGAAGAYAFATPKWYESQIAVVAATPPKMGGGAAGLAAAMSDLPLDLNISGGADVERIQAVLKSRSVTDAVIEKFHLMELYGESYVEDARKTLWTHCSTKLDKKPGVVSVTCEDKDPKRVQQMVEYFGEIGNDVFRRVTASSAREERQFLERRVAESKKDLDLTSQQLKDFEEKNRVIDLPEQSKAVVSAMAALQGEVLTKQLQLSYVNSFSANDEATTDQLRQQLSVMETKMRSLEAVEPDSKAAASTRDRRSALFPAALSVPRLRFELTGLYRQQKIQETVFFLLTQRHEMAKVNEARDTSTFQIIDHAVVPMKKSRPHRSVILVAGLAASLAVAAAWLRWLTLRRQSSLA